MSRTNRVILALLAIGLAGSALSAGPAEAGPVSRTVTGACQLPQGNIAPLSATVAIGFPDSAVAGQAIPASTVTTTITLPAQPFAQLGTPGISAVTANVAVDLTARLGGTSRRLATPNLTAPAVLLPGAGDLRLVATGALLSLVPGQAGALGYGLTDLITTVDIGGWTVACQLDPGQGGDLATVPVTGATGPAFGAPTAIPAAGSSLLPVSYGVEALTTMRKLNSSVDFTGGIFDAVIDFSNLVNPVGNVTNGTLTMPPATGNFLAFRFVPISSGIQLTQVHAPATGTFNNGQIDITLQLDIQVVSSTVNNVALDLGRTCHTATPTQLHMVGPLNLTGTSTIDSTVDIPAFTGCGVSENLDPLITGLVSGPDNPVRSTLTFRCSGDNCH